MAHHKQQSHHGTRLARRRRPPTATRHSGTAIGLPSSYASAGEPSGGATQRVARHAVGAWSQHFLRDPRLADDLVARLRWPPGGIVLEPGAGRGAITRALADAGYRVVAIEKDPLLHRTLQSRLGARKDVECHRGDILAWPLPQEPYAVVSNVPFSITAALVRRLLDAPHTPDEVLLIVQREAAERWAGSAETRIGLLYRPWFETTIERSYQRSDFTPQPSVDCVLLRIGRRTQPLLPRRTEGEWRRFTTTAFGARRQEARESLRLLFTERQIVRFARELGFARSARPSEIPFRAWLAMFQFHTQGRFGASPRRPCYLNMSRSAGRRSMVVVTSSAGVYSAPRTMATGTRASFPWTSSAAAASSSTTAIWVTRSS